MTHRLLAINFGGIGDEILFLPVLESIKKTYSDWHITLLLEPRSKAIKEITDLIDEIKLFDIKKRPLLPGDYFQLWHILASGNYQTVISSGSSPLVSCLLFASGIKKRIGYDSGPLSRLLLTSAVKLNKNQYAADMYHDLVRGLGLRLTSGLEPKQVIPKLLIPQANLVAMQNFLNSSILAEEGGRDKYGSEREQGQQLPSKKKIVIHPGTSKLAIKKGIIKTWPAENWAHLINKLLSNPQLEIILAGGPDDEETIQEINQALKEKSQTMPDSHAFISAYGATKNLADLAALISLSNLLICVDSAPMHIAVALNRPLVALFGPTNPAYLLPLQPHFKVINMNGNKSQSDRAEEECTDVYQFALDSLRQG